MVALAGPVLATLALVVGRVLGASLGEIGAIIAVAAIALALAFGIHRWRPIGIATFFTVLAVGAINAFVGNSLALLSSGEHITGAHVAEPLTWRDHERVTFGDGGERSGLFGVSGHTIGHNDSRHTTTYIHCEAVPIVPPGWTKAAPVQIWALSDRPMSGAFDQQVFHPIAKPDEDCMFAIANAVKTRELVGAADPIYLERVEVSADPYFVSLGGIVPAILCAVIWILVALLRKN